MKAKTLRLGSLAVIGAVVAPPLLMPEVASAAMTGNIGVVSNYVLRGVAGDPTATPPVGSETDGPAIQGGLDWSHASGIYLGYWGSNLGYTSDVTISTYDDNGNSTGTVDGCKDRGDCPSVGFENDFYGGYSGSLGDIGYKVGLIYYYYIGLMEFNGLELEAALSFKNFSAGMKYLTNDVGWGNAGDIYWTLGYSTALPNDFKLGATLGYYTYEEGGEFVQKTSQSSSGEFRHLDLKLSHPVGSTGADMSIAYVLGGKDRYANDLANTVVLGLSYGFDISK